MDLSSVNQKQIRKVLRSRRVSVKFVEPNSASQNVAQRKTKKRVLDASPDASYNDVRITPPKSDDGEPAGARGVEEDCDSIGKVSKIRKKNVELQLTSSKPTRHDTNISKNAEINHSEHQAGQTNEEGANELCGSESSVNNQNKKTDDEDDQGEQEGQHKTMNQDENEGRNFQENLEESESEDSEENYIENVLTEFGKDIGALYKKSNKMEKDLQEIKDMLKAGPPRHCIYRSISASFNQKMDFLLLPKFPLTKKSHVLKMSWNCDGDEDYKDQLTRKLASYGGDTVNELMINIFKNLFSYKLKTKYCWKGTTRAKGKSAFIELTGLRGVLWSAVKVHFELCTESTIKKEIKLRLNQAQKDYDREMAKNNS